MKAFIIHDDLACATRATAALKHAAWSANVSADWDIKPWRTDALRFPSLSNKALIEAADADLIVFAGPQAYSLPNWLEEWLKCWAIRRGVEDAALAVLSDVSAGVLVVPDAPRLSQFAACYGVSFVVERETWPEGQTPCIPRDLSARDAGGNALIFDRRYERKDAVSRPRVNSTGGHY
jgi:hypothetical protein